DPLAEPLVPANADREELTELGHAPAQPTERIRLEFLPRLLRVRNDPGDVHVAQGASAGSAVVWTRTLGRLKGLGSPEDGRGLVTNAEALIDVCLETLEQTVGRAHPDALPVRAATGSSGPWRATMATRRSISAARSAIARAPADRGLQLVIGILA